MDNTRKEIGPQDYFFIFLATGAYLLHTLRNISELYSGIPLLISIVGFLLYSLNRTKVDSVGFYALLLFILSYLLPLTYSYLWYPDESYTISFARYLYMIPFALFCILAIKSTAHYVFLLKVFSFFILLGGFSIFYQIVLGAISWFPEASEREGLVRFSSLAGNLTAYGIFGGLALPIIYFLFDNKMIRYCSLGIVIIAMLCTLQKAAIVNIALFFMLLFFSGAMINKLKIIGFVVFVLPLLIFVFYFLEVSYVVATVDNIFRFKEGSGASDVTFAQSLLDRLWFLPSQLYEMHGSSGLIFGVGMVGGSGTLGFPDYPMAHNGIFDLLFIGGILNLLAFSTLVIFILWRLKNLEKYCIAQSYPHTVIKVSIFIYLLIMVNMLFAGPLHVQPYGGVIFYAVTVFVCLRPDEIRRQATCVDVKR